MHACMPGCVLHTLGLVGPAFIHQSVDHPCVKAGGHSSTLTLSTCPASSLTHLLQLLAGWPSQCVIYEQSPLLRGSIFKIVSHLMICVVDGETGYHLMICGVDCIGFTWHCCDNIMEDITSSCSYTRVIIAWIVIGLQYYMASDGLFHT